MKKKGTSHDFPSYIHKSLARYHTPWISFHLSKDENQALMIIRFFYGLASFP